MVGLVALLAWTTGAERHHERRAEGEVVLERLPKSREDTQLAGPEKKGGVPESLPQLPGLCAGWVGGSHGSES